MAVAGGGGGSGEGGSSKPNGADVSSADTTAAAAAAGKEGEKEEDTFSFKGQVIAAIVVTAVAGNILGARRFRKSMVDQVARNAQRKAETERMAKAARDRARKARDTGAAGSGGEGRGGAESRGTSSSFGGNPLGGGVPQGWEFDDSREPAFGEQRLNSQVVQHLSTLGVTNFVAGRAEVKAVYRGRAMQLHPDRSADSVPGRGGSKNANEQEFKRISAAYAWLEHNYFLRRRPPS